jgi:hypothetical protein
VASRVRHSVFYEAQIPGAQRLQPSSASTHPPLADHPHESIGRGGQLPARPSAAQPRYFPYHSKMLFHPSCAATGR